MPIPNKKSGESESEFIGRCMSSIGDEYSQDQALAICYDAFRGNKETMIKTAKDRVLAKLNVINGRQRLRGINFQENGSVDMEAPCWDGYEMIGMKTLNGKQVPNCVPID